MLLSDVCLSRTLGLTREQRGLRRPKLTRDSDTTFKVKGQGHQALSTALLHEAGAAVTVRNYCYVASAWRRARCWGAHGGGEGRGHIVSPCAQIVSFVI